MFSLGRAWKQAIYTNCTFNYFFFLLLFSSKLTLVTVYFCAWWGVTLATSFALILSFQDIICPFMQILWVPQSWRYEMVFLLYSIIYCYD